MTRRLAAVMLLAAFASSPAFADADRGDSLALRSRHPAFTIAGHVRRLVPGVTRTLRLRLTDPASFPILVHEVTVTVHDASAACSHRFMWVGSYTGSLRVPARGSASLQLPITLLRAAPDACQGARFRLEFHGKAGRA